MKRFFSHAQTARACHIYKMLCEAKKKKHLSFHTPGHKRTEWDLTELSFSDCLANPTGCLLKAREDVEKIVGAKGSEFLTDGSTSGVYALLYLLKEKGVKRVALSPFSHVSVFRACALFGLQPILLTGQTPLSQPTEAQMQSGLLEADALFLTSPNYYGGIADLSLARRLCDKANKPLIVDGAHGGHLHYKPWQYAGSYADGWVDGAHKSMPAMTQGALVSVAREEWVEDLRKIVPLFRTTSPSYPIMASIEYAFKYPRNGALEMRASAFIKENSHRIYQSGDWTKIVVAFGATAQKANDWFEKQGIYPEFCDGKYVTFYLSPATKISAFERLKKAVRKAFELFPLQEEEEEQAVQVANKGQEKEWASLSNAVGRVAASQMGIFPPCLPIALDGQVLDERTVARLQEAKHTFGVEDGKVLVYTKGEKE